MNLTKKAVKGWLIWLDTQKDNITGIEFDYHNFEKPVVKIIMKKQEIRINEEKLKEMMLK